MDEMTLGKWWALATVIVIVAVSIVFLHVLGLLGPLGLDSIHAIAMVVTLDAILAIFSYFLWMVCKRRQDKKRGVPRKDERVLFFEGRAAYYAMQAGIWFMLALVWYNFLGENIFGIQPMEANPALILSLLVVAVLFIILRWRYRVPAYT